MKEIIKSKTITGVSYAAEEIKPPAQFIFCNLKECSFEGAKANTNFGSTFESCSFRKANFSESVLRGRFRNCDFTGTNLSRTLATEVVFESCLFDNTNFSKVSYQNIKFVSCTFRSCTFMKGSIGRTKFEDCQWESNTIKDVYAEGTDFPEETKIE